MGEAKGCRMFECMALRTLSERGMWWRVLGKLKGGDRWARWGDEDERAPQEVWPAPRVEDNLETEVEDSSDGEGEQVESTEHSTVV